MFRKFYRRFNFQSINYRKFLPFALIVHPKFVFSKEEIKDKELEMKDVIRGEYENRIRAFSSVEKKFFLFSKKINDSQVMEYIHFFESLIPFPYAKLLEESQIKKLLEKNKIYNDFIKTIDINGDGLISFDEYLIFCAILSIPIEEFLKKSGKNNIIQRIDFNETLMEYMVNSNFLKITEKSIFDGRIVKSDINNITKVLNEFSYKAFHQNTKIDIQKEICEMKNEFKAALLVFEYLRFPESETNKLSIQNFCKVIISYINLYKRQSFLSRLNEIIEQYKDLTVTLDEFLCFFFYLNYMQDVIKEKDFFEKNKIIKIEKLFEIEKEFSKSVKSKYFKTKFNPKLIEIVFKILDSDKSGFLDYDEIFGILNRRSIITKSNKDYVESGDTIKRYILSGIEFIKSNLWFLRKNE